MTNGTATGSGYEDGVSIEVLVDHPTIRVVRVTLEPGKVTSTSGYSRAYVTSPRTDGNLVRTLLRDGAVIHEENITLSAHKPYAVDPLGKDVAVRIRNVGTSPVVWDKSIPKDPDTAPPKEAPPPPSGNTKQ
jgi:hypothetical protein